MTLQSFHKELLQEIKTTQLTEEEGGTQEQIFTQIAIDLLSEAGETENARLCFDRKEDSLGRTMHKLNGYALSENYETLDLFVSGFRSNDEIVTITKQETETLINQVEKFFRNAVYKEYVNDLEESSEVFDLAHTLAEVQEVKDFLSRVNIYVLSNATYKSDINYNKTISGYNVFIRVIDIEYLYNLSDQSRVPIELNFKEYGDLLPCLKAPCNNEDYESYLILIPGTILANVYEEYGSRLLEQNVRSFLQFTGKINKGIRETIRTIPHMFLAYNNGIAATAESIEVVEDGFGQKAISWAKDFQIVNGGQTTASIYHTWKKDKADVSQIFVQTKLTVVKKRDNFGDIVSRIAEYANTQNKVSTSDLSSNKPFHVEMEKISRSVWAPPTNGSNVQTRWFYERARGQYKNARAKEGLTPKRRKAFDMRNPRNQMLSKELLAKYVNSYGEVTERGKIVIGPHVVVRGSQKNYAQFLNYNMPKDPDSIFFEDTVAKAILFKGAERLYGVKPNAIGDMRYITVPYAIAYLHHKTSGQLDIYKIWLSQMISKELEETLFSILEDVELFIKNNAPGSLYGEWAKKEECWEKLKGEEFDINFESIKDDLMNSKSPKRKKITEEEIDQKVIQQEISLIKSVPLQKWSEISKLGNDIDGLTSHLKDRSVNILSALKQGKDLSEKQRIDALKIIDVLISKIEDFFDENDTKAIDILDDSPVVINEVNLRKIVEWDTKAQVLTPKELQYLANFAYGLKKLNSFHEKNIERHIERLLKAGLKL